jgi:hypothetical protein
MQVAPGRSRSPEHRRKIAAAMRSHRELGSRRYLLGLIREHADAEGPINTFVRAPEASGTLRLVRTGSTLTAYRLVGASWEALQSTPDSANEVAFNLNVFTNAPQYSNGDVTVAYDNFRISDGTFSCPSWWDDNAPDWQPVLRD